MGGGGGGGGEGKEKKGWEREASLSDKERNQEMWTLKLTDKTIGREMKSEGENERKRESGTIDFTKVKSCIVMVFFFFFFCGGVVCLFVLWIHDSEYSEGSPKRLDSYRVRESFYRTNRNYSEQLALGNELPETTFKLLGSFINP